MYHKRKQDPALTNETLEAIGKIQRFGYQFVFDLTTRTYQILETDGTVVETFDEWVEIINYADNLHDKRQK